MKLSKLLPSFLLAIQLSTLGPSWGVLLFIFFVHPSGSGGVLAGLWEGSGLQGSGLGVSHVVFLVKVVWECKSWATIVP